MRLRGAGELNKGGFKKMNIQGAIEYVMYLKNYPVNYKREKLDDLMELLQRLRKCEIMNTELNRENVQNVQNN